MRFRIKSTILGLCVFLPSSFALAATSTTDAATLEKSLEQLTAQTQALQKQIQELKAELRQVKQAQKTKVSASAKSEPIPNPQPRKPQGISTPPHQVPATTAQAVGTPSVQPGLKDVPVTQGDAPGVAPTPEQQANMDKLRTQYYTLGPTVTTSPYLGLRSAYDASDLIVNLSTMNEDLRFLKERQELEEDLGVGMPALNRPVLQLGGKVEAQGLYQTPYSGDAVSNVNLSTAEFDTLALASPWALAFMSWQFDSTALSNNLVGSGDLTNNSRVYLRRGFITIGNLNESPWYLSAGQMYVPFGTYSSMILSNPDTLVLGRTVERAAVLGFSKGGFYASGYAFNGQISVTDDDNSTVNGFGLNGGYTFNGNKWSGDFGAGWINDLANSEGMQNNGASYGSFQGFDQNSTTEQLIHHVPGVNAHAQLGYGPFKVLGEYITAVRSFDPRDMTFNNGGAIPRALYAEADYAFEVFTKPSNIALGYSQSWQSLALLIPKNSYIVAFSTSIWKNTIESLEFRHDANYAGTDTAGGRCATNNELFCPITSQGGQQNTLIAQIGVYF